MGLENNLKYAREAILYTTKNVPLGADNIAPGLGYNTLRFLIMRLDVLILKRLMSYFLPSYLSEMRYLRIVDHRVKNYGVGNCGEQSAVAYCYLRDVKKIRKLDLISLRGADHQCVVIGRADNSNLYDPGTWGEHAVICDPWGDRYFPAKDMDYQFNQIFLKNNFPQIDSSSGLIQYGFGSAPYAKLIDDMVHSQSGNNKVTRQDRKAFAERKLADFHTREKSFPPATRANLESYIEINSHKKEPPELSEAEEKIATSQYKSYVTNWAILFPGGINESAEDEQKRTLWACNVSR